MTTYDYLVIGSGIAGLTFALEAAPHGRVAIITKRALEDSNTAWAQGGVAAVWSEEDSIENHVADTLGAGCDLSNEDVVRTVVTEGPDRIRELIERGVPFSRKLDGNEYDLGLEGGHTRRR